jgi:hypothetical protein
MKSKIFPYIIATAALAVSLSAAFYSVYGLGKLFAGASLQVMIMAGSLEFAKLVIASALYQYWSTINKVLRTYLVIAVIVLMTITSAGIYGYLSGAYQQTDAGTEIVNRQVSVIEAKKHSFEEQRSQYIAEKEQLTGSITQLRTAISNPGQSQYIDKKTGQVITNTNASARSLLQTELNTAISERNLLDTKIQALNDSISSADISVIELKNSDESVRELGPLMYLSNLTGLPMDRVINWYILLIVFVFDPLAIALVVVANQAFSKKKYVVTDEDIEKAMADETYDPYSDDEIERNWYEYQHVTASKPGVEYMYTPRYAPPIEPVTVTSSIHMQETKTTEDNKSTQTPNKPGNNRPVYWA